MFIPHVFVLFLHCSLFFITNGLLAAILLKNLTRLFMFVYRLTSYQQCIAISQRNFWVCSILFYMPGNFPDLHTLHTLFLSLSLSLRPGTRSMICFNRCDVLKQSYIKRPRFCICLHACCVFLLWLCCESAGYNHALELFFF